MQHEYPSVFNCPSVNWKQRLLCWKCLACKNGSIWCRGKGNKTLPKHNPGYFTFLLIRPELFKWVGTRRQMRSEENLISTLNGASEFPIHAVAIFTGIDGCHCYQSWQASCRWHNRLELLEPFIIPEWQILMISFFHRHCSFLFLIWHGSSTLLLLGCRDKTTPLKLKERQLWDSLNAAACLPLSPALCFENQSCVLLSEIKSWVIPQCYLTHNGLFLPALDYIFWLNDLKFRCLHYRN